MKDRKPARARKRMDLVTGFQKSDPKLGREIQAKIGQQLRAIYDDVVNQGVPDRFAELLNRLDKSNGATPSDGKPGDGRDA